MTLEEFNNLKEGDVVYYFREPSFYSMRTISATITRKKVKLVLNKKDDYGKYYKRVGLEPSGIIIESLLHLFSLNEKEALYLKLKQIKNKYQQGKKEGVIDYAQTKKYNKLFKQKNVLKIIEKYPEIFI